MKGGLVHPGRRHYYQNASLLMPRKTDLNGQEGAVRYDYLSYMIRLIIRKQRKRFILDDCDRLGGLMQFMIVCIPAGCVGDKKHWEKQRVTVARPTTVGGGRVLCANYATMRTIGFHGRWGLLLCTNRGGRAMRNSLAEHTNRSLRFVTIE